MKPVQTCMAGPSGGMSARPCAQQRLKLITLLPCGAMPSKCLPTEVPSHAPRLLLCPHQHTLPAMPALLPPQSKYLLTEAPTHAPLTPRVLAGAALWLAGWLTNLQADHILINLRKPGETGELFWQSTCCSGEALPASLLLL